jgi:serine/threonine-protein kinase
LLTDNLFLHLYFNNINQEKQNKLKINQTKSAYIGASMTAASEVTGVLSPGTELLGGVYQVNKVLGQGGFGITYQGVDLRLNRSVALKEFFPEGCWRQGTTVVSAGKWTSATYSDAKQKFLQEGQTLGQFNHSGIVRVFYYFEENNTAYMVMEYLHGRTLADLLTQRGGKLSQSEALMYIGKICQALEILHHNQFLHRDIKPDNIMLTNDERVVLIDFGAARDFTTRNTQRFTAMFTPGYAPLEQYGQALQLGTFTDIYALGATLYHLLTGKVPVSAVERAAGVELPSIRQLNPQTSNQVADAVKKAMEMDVNKRCQSIREFLDLLGNRDLSKEKSEDLGFYQSHEDPWSAFEGNKKIKSNLFENGGKWF